jgi:hypothetical protein
VLAPEQPNGDYADCADVTDTASVCLEERRTPRGTIRVIREIRVIVVPPVDARERRSTPVTTVTPTHDVHA